MLIAHIVGVVLGVGASFSFLFMGLSLKKKTKEEADQLLLNLLPINLMGKIGLTLLILSGGYLMTPYWSIMTNMPYLMAKLILVAVLVVCIGIMEMYTKKAKQNNGGVYLDKLSGIGRFVLAIGVLIIILAVLTFH